MLVTERLSNGDRYIRIWICRLDSLGSG